MFLWNKRRFLIEKFLSELMWVYDCDIYFVDSGVNVNGMEDDVNACLCCIDGLLLGYKRKEVKDE